MMEDEQGPVNPVYSIIKYSILTICIIATSYRIYSNYQTYCEYKVLINSKVELTDVETLPQLSLCFYEILDADKLSTFNESLRDEYDHLINDSSKFREWKMEQFSFKSLFDLSFEYADYFINCTYLDQEAIRELNCSNLYNVTLSMEKKCFNFFHRSLDEDNEVWTYNRILLQNR